MIFPALRASYIAKNSDDSYVILLQVRYLKIIEKSGYQALPWVRYITQNGGKFFFSVSF